MTIEAKVIDKSCTCAKCRQGCRDNPGWFTPEEARNAIDAGYAPRLMRDWLEPNHRVGNDERIWILAPASAGCEGDDAPEIPEYESIVEAMFSKFTKGRCVFLTKDERCEIHTTGFKPVQCRTAFMCGKDRGGWQDNYAVARLWDTDIGRAVISEWRRIVGIPEDAA